MRRKEALARGYRSLIVLPLIVGGAAVGNLSLFAMEPDFFDEEELKLLAQLCAKRAALKLQDIAFGFRRGGSLDRETGRYVGGGNAVGLTCSTFVMEMCSWAAIDLVDAETWEPRKDDAGFHKQMVDALVLKRAPPEHIAAVRAEAGCVRFRAEEVAACSAFSSRPVAFADAAPAGARLAEDYYQSTSG